MAPRMRAVLGAATVLALSRGGLAQPPPGFETIELASADEGPTCASGSYAAVTDDMVHARAALETSMRPMDASCWSEEGYWSSRCTREYDTSAMLDYDAACANTAGRATWRYDMHITCANDAIYNIGSWLDCLPEDTLNCAMLVNEAMYVPKCDHDEEGQVERRCGPDGSVDCRFTYTRLAEPTDAPTPRPGSLGIDPSGGNPGSTPEPEEPAQPEEPQDEAPPPAPVAPVAEQEVAGQSMSGSVPWLLIGIASGALVVGSLVAGVKCRSRRWKALGGARKARTPTASDACEDGSAAGSRERSYSDGSDDSDGSFGIPAERYSEIRMDHVREILNPNFNPNELISDEDVNTLFTDVDASGTFAGRLASPTSSAPGHETAWAGDEPLWAPQSPVAALVEVAEIEDPEDMA